MNDAAQFFWLMVCCGVVAVGMVVLLAPVPYWMNLAGAVVAGIGFFGTLTIMFMIVGLPVWLVGALALLTAVAIFREWNSPFL